MVSLAINGFGRIGRVALRVALTKYLDKVKVVAVNTSGSMDINGWAQLFEYDSVYGRFKGKVEVQKVEKGNGIGTLIINHQRIPVLAQRDPAKISWKKYDVEVVIESTGVFREKKLASTHLQSGAKKVLISAPAEGVETFIIGVNEDQYRGSLVNNASCTTNCVAPVAKVMMENFGIQKAHMATIHAVTADQQLVDGSHRKDLRRARAAGVNIIPTSTGAAKATIQVLPSLRGVFDGMAYRVPVICGSVADFTFLTTKRTLVEEVNKVFQKAAQGKHRGIIEVSDKPLVSTDIIGNPASAIIDLSLTQVIDGDLVKIVAWYDNEWGYCCRLVEMASLIGEGKRERKR